MNNDTKDRNAINIDNLDCPLYRIYKLDRFEEVLITGNNTLVNPAEWGDPFENFFLEKTEVADNTTNAMIPLKNLAADWYGQCWSMQAESDAMWRIYSPSVDRPGIKVRTTARKLFNNLIAAGSVAPYLQFFIGRVCYKIEDEIRDLMHKLTFHDVVCGGQSYKLAALLCIKREAFSHEQEVRLLFHDLCSQDLGPKRGRDKLFNYKLNANAIFEEVVLDPRLKEDKVKILKSKLRTSGYTGPIQESSLYRSPHFIIPIQ